MGEIDCAGEDGGWRIRKRGEGEGEDGRLRGCDHVKRRGGREGVCIFPARTAEHMWREEWFA